MKRPTVLYNAAQRLADEIDDYVQGDEDVYPDLAIALHDLRTALTNLEAVSRQRFEHGR